MYLTLLGTGSPESYARRASSGYLLEVGGARLMFDCGGGAVGRLIQAGTLPQDLDTLFLTHLHTDHMMDYPRLVHAAWDAGKADLSVVGPAPMAEVSDRFFGAQTPFFADLKARTEHPPSQEIWQERGGELPRPLPSPQVTEIEGGWSMKTKDYRIQCIEVPHAQPFLTCLAYRIDAGGRSIVYSGDSGPSAELTRLAQGADILIHMCFQLSQEARGPEWLKGSSGHLEVAQTALDAGVATVVLTHLRPHMDREGVHGRIRAEMASIYRGKVVVGEDLMRFDLEPMPSSG